ncbi:MAG: Lpp/OprI family alanine-zipper lipoprotein [Alphaproteobacteria bacterium]
MISNVSRFGKLAVVVAPLALLGACANLGADDKALLQKTASNSEAALVESRRASESAAQAMAAARQAQATAQQALQAAQAAQADARAANEKFDRAFRRGMRK